MDGPFYDADNYTTRQSVGYLLRRAFKLMHPQIEARFEGSGFTLSQWIALKTVAEGIATTAAGIARELSHNSGATTRLVDQLEAMGLLRRARRNADRRLVDLEVTPEGYALIEQLNPLARDMWNDLLADFSREEAVTLIALLQRVVARLEAGPLPARTAE